jgi:hypothetical protein
MTNSKFFVNYNIGPEILCLMLRKSDKREQYLRNCWKWLASFIFTVVLITANTFYALHVDESIWLGILRVCIIGGLGVHLTRNYTKVHENRLFPDMYNWIQGNERGYIEYRTINEVTTDDAS